MKYMYELDYSNLNIDKEKFMANLEELHYKSPRNYYYSYYSLEAIFRRLGYKGDMASILEDCKLIYENGIEEGYGKFVFFSDTKQFFEENRDTILDHLDDMAYQILGSEDSSIVDLIYETSKSSEGYLKHGKDYLVDFIYDPQENCNSLYNMLVWMYVQDVINFLMEEDSEKLLKGAIK